MLDYYEQALKLFQIESGFVDEQLEEMYKQLLENCESNVSEYFSSKYLDEKLRKDKIRRAYKWLQEPFRHYIVSSLSSEIKQEQLEEDILKLVHDYRKQNYHIDEYFIAQLVELLVSNKELHQYLRDIEFKKNKRNSLAGYEQDGTLTVYSDSILEYIISPNNLEGIDNEYYPYYIVISLITHEVEHANQKREKEKDISSIKSQIWKACDYFRKQYDLEFQKILKFSNPLFELLNLKLKFLYSINQIKYQRCWEYSPKERIADLIGYNLVLSLIEKSNKKEELEALRNIFTSNFRQTLFFGYDKQIIPTEYYLKQFKMQAEYLRISEMAKKISLEERLLLGIFISDEELEQLLNEEKIIDKVRILC